MGSGDLGPGDSRNLAGAISRILADVNFADLSQAARALSARYRAGEAAVVKADIDTMAYVATRLPATFGSASLAMECAAELMPSFAPQSQLDLGAGPGAAAWAAAGVWPSIETVALWERDDRVTRVGEQLALNSFPGWTWQRSDMRQSLDVRADLVTATYALGELDRTDVRDVASRAWDATTGCLVIVEPGTPAGFSLIRDLRDHLIREGATLIAPCPNADACPIAGDDWCHFAARVSRSALHRQLKGGERSFEDEKFSYVVFTRQRDLSRAAGRVVRRPVRRRRFVELSVCRAGQIERIGLGRSHSGYAVASKLVWGAAVPEATLDPPSPT